MVHIAPPEFGKPFLTAIMDALSEKYPNKVVLNLGLCVAIYDVIHVGESQIYPGNASHHTTVEFRLVIFKPFVGEVLDGSITSCDAQGVRISLGFFDEVHVPGRLLQEGSVWSEDEQVWVWCVPGTDSQLFFDVQNPLRFRVEAVHYRQPSNEAAKVAAATTLSDRVGESRATTPIPKSPTTPQPTPPPTPGTPGTSASSKWPKVPFQQQPAMQIFASMDRAGLGLTTWWPADDDDGGEEEEEDGGMMLDDGLER